MSYNYQQSSQQPRSQQGYYGSNATPAQAAVVAAFGQSRQQQVNQPPSMVQAGSYGASSTASIQGSLPQYQQQRMPMTGVTQQTQQQPPAGRGSWDEYFASSAAAAPQQQAIPAQQQQSMPQQQQQQHQQGYNRGPVPQGGQQQTPQAYANYNPQMQNVPRGNAPYQGQGVPSVAGGPQQLSYQQGGGPSVGQYGQQTPVAQGAYAPGRTMEPPSTSPYDPFTDGSSQPYQTSQMGQVPVNRQAYQPQTQSHIQDPRYHPQQQSGPPQVSPDPRYARPAATFDGASRGDGYVNVNQPNQIQYSDPNRYQPVQAVPGGRYVDPQPQQQLQQLGVQQQPQPRPGVYGGSVPPQTQTSQYLQQQQPQSLYGQQSQQHQQQQQQQHQQQPTQRYQQQTHPSQQTFGSHGVLPSQALRGQPWQNTALEIGGPAKPAYSQQVDYLPSTSNTMSSIEAARALVGGSQSVPLYNQSSQAPAQYGKPIANISVPSLSALTANIPKTAAGARNAGSNWGSPPSSVSKGFGAETKKYGKGVSNFSEPVVVAGKYGPASGSGIAKKTTTSSSRDDDRRPVLNRRSRSRSSSRNVPSSAGKRRAPSRSPPRPSKAPSNSSAPGKKVDYSSMSFQELGKEYHNPIIGRHCHTLATQDLYLRFPDLYVPTDFVRAEVDWDALSYASFHGVFSGLFKAGNFLIETNPAYLPNDSSYPPYAILDEPPKFTFMHPSEGIHNRHVASVTSLLPPSMTEYGEKIVEMNAKAVKYNARVIITLGFKNPETERVDSTLTRKLRVLMGKKKGNVMLLGGSWCQELDGGDPSVDRACLANTARRSVLAHSLLDIQDEHICSLTKLFEISYHRPQEEFKGRTYPEQDEISVVFHCAVLPSKTSSAYTEDYLHHFEDVWQVFQSRVAGKSIGPTLNCDDADSLPVEAATKEHIQEPTEEPQHEQEESSSRQTADGTGGEAMEVAEAEAVAPPVNESKDDETQVSSQTSQEEALKTTPAPAEGAPAETATEATLHPKPTLPCALICPPPLPKDFAIDAQKRNDSTTLRVIPLSSVLSYSHDDSNERVFEASLAAEVLRSAVGVTYANIITDFLVAGHTYLYVIADPRIYFTVKKLRSIAAKTIEKVAMKSTNGDAKSADDSSPLKLSETQVIEAGEEPEPVVNDANGNKPAENDMTNDDSTLAETKVTDEEFPIDEDDARQWRRLFVSACRWFDVAQEHFLRHDHLQLVLLSSARDISRIDATTLAWDACKDERLRYESYI